MASSERKDAMYLAAFIAASTQGFALPLYKSSSRDTNVWYTATPSIERDHHCHISGFEPFSFDENNLILLPESSIEQVYEGSRWLDVFNHKGQPFVGTAEKILNDIELTDHGMLQEAPISFLNLALAAEVDIETTRSIVASARGFLSDRLIKAKAEQFFQTIILQPRIIVEVARIAHRTGLGSNSTYRNFDIKKIGSKHYQIIFKFKKEDVLANIESSEELNVKLSEFAEKLGVKFDLKFLNNGIFSETQEVEEDPEMGSTVKAKPVRTRLLGIARELAIDLGSTRTRIYRPGLGIILDEPSAVATKAKNGVVETIRFGQTATNFDGKLPKSVEVVRPIVDGKIVDIDLCSTMLTNFLQRVTSLGEKIRPLDVVVSTTFDATDAQKKGLYDSIKKVGVSRVSIIPQGIAAAIGSGLNMDDHTNILIVNVGGGVTELSLIASGELADSKLVNFGGAVADDLLVEYIRRHYNMLISLDTAIELKESFGRCIEPTDNIGHTTHLTGRDLVNGVPKEISINQGQVTEAIADVYGHIMEGIRLVLEETPPGLAGALIQNGILLTGNGAKIDGLVELVEDTTGLKARVSENPETSVIEGLGKILEVPELRRFLDEF